MSEMLEAVITAGLTIISGVVVWVFIEPVHELFKLRGEVADSLVFYADVYSNRGK